jgi:hypothetical protein
MCQVIRRYTRVVTMCVGNVVLFVPSLTHVLAYIYHIYELMNFVIIILIYATAYLQPSKCSDQQKMQHNLHYAHLTVQQR